MEAQEGYRPPGSGLAARPSPWGVILAWWVGICFGLAAPGAQAATNDAFASRIRIIGDAFSTQTDNRGASREAGEPNHAGQGGRGSLWWIWQPSEPGQVVIETTGSRVDTLLAAYFGKELGVLSHVASNDDGATNGPASRIEFNAEPQRDYPIALDSKGGQGDLVLSLKLYTNPVLFNTLTDQDVTDGDNVTLCIEAIGLNPLQYQWQRFGTNLPGQTGSCLTIRAAKPEDAGTYRVVVSNAKGSVTSGVSRVRVLARPKVVEHPVGATVTAGDDFQFSVRALGENPLRYQWLREDTIPVGADLPVLAFQNISTDEAGYYRVRVSNQAGQALSDIAKLVVQPGPPVITQQPTNQVVVEGTSVQMNVGVRGYRPFSFQWSHEDRPLTNGTSQVLFLPNARVSQSGLYSVTISNRYGVNKSQQARLTVEPRPPNDHFTNRIRLTGAVVRTNGFNKHGTKETGEPAHDRQPPTQSVWWSYTATNRGVVTITLAGSSFDTVLSAYEGLSVDRLTKVTSNDNAEGSLQSRVQFLAEPNREYSFAVDGVDGSFGDIKIELTFNPEIGLPIFDLAFGPLDLFLLGLDGEGCRPAQFNAKAISIAPITYQWQFGGVNLPGQTNATLILTNASLLEAGEYRVLACNVAGCTSSPPVRLTVSPLPLITRQPADFEIRDCGTRTWEVEVDGGCLPFATQWYFRGQPIPGATRPVFGITNAQPDRAGAYYVVFTNSYGAVTSRIASVTVDTRPRITSHPEAPTDPVNECNDISLSLAVEAQCRPNQLQWLLDRQPVPGATNPVFRFQATADTAGEYSVRVFNDFSSVTSNPTRLRVRAEPLIFEHPDSRRLRVGSTFTNRVQVLTCSELQFEWRRNDSPVALDGNHLLLTNGFLVVRNAQVSDSGTYDVLVRSRTGQSLSRSAVIDVRFPPPNDNFVDRITLTGTNLTTLGTNILATSEVGEPSHARQPPSRSVWWTWTSPVPSLVTVDLSGSSFDTLLGVYRGQAVGSLTTVTNDDQGGANNASKVSFLAARGRNVHFAVDGRDSAEGSIVLRLVAQEINSPPVITNQPRSIAAITGDRVSFVVRASGSPDILYQWRFNAVPIPGATKEVFEIPSVQPSDEGNYTVVLSNEYGTVESQIARLTYGAIIEGQVTDATNRRGIPGALVSVVNTANPSDTNYAVATLTDTNGNYTLVGVRPGVARAEFDANKRRVRIGEPVSFKNLSTLKAVVLKGQKTNYFDYIDYQFEVPQGRVVTNKFSMSPFIGGMRFVVNWGLQPADLDAHLLTPEMDGARYHVQYPPTDRGSPDRPPFATLDYDVQDSFGPETLTIYRFERGTYRFYLKKFDPNATGALNQSRGIVKLYTADGLFGTREVPTTGEGTIWHVCDIDGETRAVTWVDRILAVDPPYADLPALVRPTGEADRVRLARPAAPDYGSSRFQWKFGDGQDSSETEPVHRYRAPGLYPVELALFAKPGATVPDAVLPKPDFILVTNTPPVASLLAPATNEIFRLGPSFQVRADAFDVDGRVVRVEFFAIARGATNRFAVATNAPYAVEYSAREEGPVTFFARAIDDFEGVGLTARVPVSIRDLDGDILIIRNFPNPEIDALESYLAEFRLPDPNGGRGEPPVVKILDQEGLKLDLVLHFKLIIWDDLGQVAGGLTENDVAILHEAHLRGVPLYLIGERLSASLDNLSGTARSLWQGLTHLGDSAGTLSQPALTRLPPAALSPELFDSSYFGPVADFTYPGTVDDARRVGDSAAVRAAAGDVPLVLRFPRFGESAGVAARSVSQAFLVTAGTATDPSQQERRRLFLNTTQWLLGYDCGYFDVFLTCPPSPLAGQVGQVLTIPLQLSATGRCNAEGVVLTNLLPAGLDLLEVRARSIPEGANQSRVYQQGGLWVVRAGEMGRGSTLDVELDVIPRRGGSFSIAHTLGANNRAPLPCATAIQVDARDCPPVQLRIEPQPDGTLRILWTGGEGCRAILERSGDLRQWHKLLEKETSATWQEAYLILPSEDLVLLRVLSSGDQLESNKP